MSWINRALTISWSISNYEAGMTTGGFVERVYTETAEMQNNSIRNLR